MSSSGGQAQAVSAQHLLPRIQRGFKFALMNFKGPMALSHLGKKLSGLAVLRHEETWIALSPSRAFNAHQAPSIPLQSLMSWALTSIPFRNGMRPHPKQRSTTTIPACFPHHVDVPALEMPLLSRCQVDLLFVNAQSPRWRSHAEKSV